MTTMPNPMTTATTSITTFVVVTLGRHFLSKSILRQCNNTKGARIKLATIVTIVVVSLLTMYVIEAEHRC